ncbi:MAG: hypothetical protein RLZZ297_1029 [Chloroflexota bacterium]
MRMGVDTGGTFTDFVRIENGTIQIAKRLSTPDNPARALLDEVALHPAPDVLIHGTTVATNALLERRGAVTALVTTAGFTDVLAIGRGDRPSLYDLGQTRPEPLVPTALRMGVAERTTHNRQIVRPLDDAAVTALFPMLDAACVRAIAVCLLHSYVNPEHEERIAALLAAHNPAWHVSVSHRILREAREYERTVTTVVNAYVAPVMQRYLGDLAARLPATTKLRVMASDGGSMGVAGAYELPARTTLSGPAGGIVGAFRVAQALGYPRCITFDMGGTSTDVALCDGALPQSSGSAVGGLPVRLPSLDIHTVGAGGGSLARIDSAGALRVGPQSAGARPGPACYGTGTAATVTDANVVLGRLRPDAFLGGTMQLDTPRADAAVDVVAHAAGSSRSDAALGIIRVVNAAMARAVRTISVERGEHPREYALVAFGGAGPLHAVALAEELGMETVIVPRYPGVLSALGMVTAAVTRHTSRPVLAPLDTLTTQAVQAIIDDTTAELRTALASDGENPDTFAHTITLALRYRGQVFELDVPFLTTPVSTAAALAAVADQFHRLHTQRYGHAMPDRAIECVALAHRLANEPALIPQAVEPSRSGVCTPNRWAACAVDDDAQPQATAIYDRSALRPGDVFAGPAIVTQLDATTVVPTGWRVVVAASGDLVVTQANGR